VVADEQISVPGGEGLKVEQLPDIYFNLLDEYARGDAREQMYGFDNSGFLDFLGSMGFYVASKSRTNYIHTKASMPATLKMRYHHGLDTWGVAALPDMVSTNESYAAQVAKSLGYESLRTHETPFFHGSAFISRKGPIGTVQRFFRQVGELHCSESRSFDSLLDVAPLL